MIKYIRMVSNIYGENMERRYISEERYKKVSRKASRKRTVKRISNSKSSLKNKNIQMKKKSNNKKYKVNKNKFVRFVFCFLLIVVIAVIARAITREEHEPFILIFSNNVEENTESIDIAIYDSVNINTNNFVITELEQYIYPMLLRINSDYSLGFEIISNISKINNKEYEIDINEKSGINTVDVKDRIDSIINEKNKYYSKVQNIDKVEIKSENKLYITLKTEDEYFIYNLNIPIYKSVGNYGLYNIDNSSNENMLKLVRKDNVSKEYVKYINIIKVASEDTAISMYKQGSLDVFFSTTTNVAKMLGKYEYDIKAYNSGESIFLIFNPKSSIINEKYIRQIVAYSIDRENILSEVQSSNGKVIDLPYINDEIKYKYDVYAADNLLLSNGYKKNKLYYAKAGKNLTLKLLVNEADEKKVNIANKIKNDLLKVGVNVTINKASEKQILNIKSTNDYDMLLASIYINENPNINYLKDSLIISSDINDKMRMIKDSEYNGINQHISDLKTTLSDNISMYGIYSKSNYVVCRKNLEVFKNINYMNLFSEYFNK